MCRKFAWFVSIVVLVGLSAPLGFANEDERYEFDGMPDDPNYASDPNNLPYDPTDWMTSVNWAFGPFGPDPDSLFGPLLPDFGTRVEIDEVQYGVNAPVIGPGDTAEAYGVRIGRTASAGLLTMNGGTLEIRDGGFNCQILGGDSCSRLRVGNDDSTTLNSGTFNLSGGTVTTDTLWIGSGSHGEMNMSGGEVNTRTDLYFDWTFDSSSVLNMTGGTINVGTSNSSPFRLHRTSLLNLDGGEILISGAAQLGFGEDMELSLGGPQIPNVTVSITDGLLRANQHLKVAGSLTIDGGIVRANSYLANDPNSAETSLITVNGSGLLQFNNAQESVLDVEALIASGVITTSEASPLTVSIVDVGGTDFTQVSFATACGTGDFDCNGIVDGNDFLLWQTGGSPVPLSASDLADWENNYATPLVAAVASVPEPSSVVLVMLVSVSMAFGCRNFRGTKSGTNQFS